jgi:hypothetical protein
MSASLMVLVGSVFAFCSPDEVKMKDGKEYKNLTLAKETATHYTFVDLDDKKITIAKDQIEKYEKKPTIRDEVRQRVKSAGADAKALYDIAGWAKAQGLPKDAREVLEIVIKTDPEHAEARAALDHVKFEGVWVSKKDLEAKHEAAKGAELKALGYKLEGAKWVSPAEMSRTKAKLVAVGPYWVTADQKKLIDQKGLEYRDGDWLLKEEVEKFEKGERKVKGVWKPVLDADEDHREAKDPWDLRGRYVQMRSTLRHAKSVLGFKAANDAVNAAVELCGVEPDVYGKLEHVVLLIERDIDGYKAQGSKSGSDWSSMRSSDDGVFYSPKLAKDRGASVTYFHDENYMKWWGGRGGFEAYVGRITDPSRLDPVLLDAFAGYFASIVDDKYSPACVANFLFDRSKPMKTPAKMFEGFSRKDAYALPQAGFLVHFLVKKNKDATGRALRKFLAGNLRSAELVTEVLGKLPQAELEAEFNEVWTKFRDNYRP